MEHGNVVEPSGMKKVTRKGAGDSAFDESEEKANGYVQCITYGFKLCPTRKCADVLMVLQCEIICRNRLMKECK